MPPVRSGPGGTAFGTRRLINGLVWGPPMLVLILGTGLYLSVGLKAMPLRGSATAFGCSGAGAASRGRATSRRSTR
jgi:Na+/alanine symporter